MWTETLLNLTVEQEMEIMRSDKFTPAARRAAYDRMAAKRWYELIVLSDPVVIDLPDLAPDEASEVVGLRTLVGVNPPWLRKALAA